MAATRNAFVRFLKTTVVFLCSTLRRFLRHRPAGGGFGPRMVLLGNGMNETVGLVRRSARRRRRRGLGSRGNGPDDGHGARCGNGGGRRLGRHGGRRTTRGV